MTLLNNTTSKQEEFIRANIHWHVIQKNISSVTEYECQVQDMQDKWQDVPHFHCQLLGEKHLRKGERGCSLNKTEYLKRESPGLNFLKWRVRL